MTRKKKKLTPLYILLTHLVAFGIGIRVSNGSLPLPQANFKDEVVCAFSPKGKCATYTIELIQKAQKEIYVAIYCLNHPAIAQALVKAHKRGVQVKIIACKSQRKVKNEQLTMMSQTGIPIRLGCKVKIMHHKFMVVDGRWIATGSFNYTRPGDEKNAENLLILSSPLAVSEYTQNWASLWEQAIALKEYDTKKKKAA